MPRVVSTSIQSFLFFLKVCFICISAGFSERKTPPLPHDFLTSSSELNLYPHIGACSDQACPSDMKGSNEREQSPVYEMFPSQCNKLGMLAPYFSIEIHTVDKVHRDIFHWFIFLPLRRFSSSQEKGLVFRDGVKPARLLFTLIPGFDIKTNYPKPGMWKSHKTHIKLRLLLPATSSYYYNYYYLKTLCMAL